MDPVIERSIDGLTLGVIYSLISVAYSLAWGAARPLLFANGALYLIGAALSAGVISTTAMNAPGSELLALLLSLTVALTAGVIAGWAIGRCVHQPFGRRSELLAFPASAGLFLVAAGSLQLADRLGMTQFPGVIIAPRAVLFIPGVTNAGIILVMPVILVGGVLVMAAILYLTGKTAFGRARRAIVQDRQLAELLGLDLRRINSANILLASILAVLAGWMMTINHGPVDLNGGLLTAASAFAAAAIGGLRSPRRAAAVGFLAGLANAFWTWFFSPVYAGIAVFALLFFVLIIVQPVLAGRRAVEEF